ncbi:hypothetical protein SAMN05519103_09483 [Rhizobiales bacterium GAS113]|nr:hypothetical protein SAMN05519103_09483 [Rhizobiales bacterium GAS113]
MSVRECGDGDAMPAETPRASADLESAVEAAIGACDGDPRAAVRALIVANAFLEEDLARTRAMVSRGYARGVGLALR